MSGFVAGAVVGAIAIGGATAIVVGAVVGYAVAEGLKSMIPDMPDVGAGTQGALTNKASSNDPIPILYGERRIGGTKVFVETGGTDNKFLHQVLILGEGEIYGVSEIFVDDESLSGSKYASFVDIHAKRGGLTHGYSAALVTASNGIWTSQHTLTGIAYIYAKLTYDQDTFLRGIPTLTFVVKGTLVHDPRVPTAANAWSDNPALCIRDYLTNEGYGRGIPADEIDDASFSVAANYCDNMITLGTVSKKRYTCNGIVNTESGSIPTLKALMTCCKGILVFSAGKYKLLIDKPETATFDFDDNNIIGGWSIKMGSKATRFNKVSADFVNKETQWRDDIAIASSATYKTNDNGLKLETTMKLPFNTDIERARMLCAIALNQSRNQTSVTFLATIDALNVEVGEVVNITDVNMGWSNKTFRVMRMDIKSSSEIKVTAVEFESTAFNYGTIDAQDTINTTNIIDMSTVAAPTGVVVTENLTLPSTAMNVTWSVSADAFVTRYSVQYKLSSSSTWVSHGYSVGNTTAIRDIVTGVYDVRVKAENTAGTSSSWSVPVLGAFTITASPTMPNVTNLAVKDNNTSIVNEFTGRDAKFEWDDFRTSTTQDPLLFADYVVSITKVDGTAVRTEAVHDSEYVYTYEKNLEDGAGTPLRQFRIGVTQRGNKGQVSPVPTTIGNAIGGATPYPNNPAPATPSATVNATFNTMFMSFNAPSDTDFAGYKVWASKATPVTTNDGDLVYKGTDNLVVLSKVDSGGHNGALAEITGNETIYYKFAAYDAFGEANLNISSQGAVTTGLAPVGGIQTYYDSKANVTCNTSKDGALLFDTTPITGNNKPYRCNGTAWVVVNDVAISNSQIVANTITAASIAAGTITGNEIDVNNISAHNVNVGSSATTGARMNISATTIKIYDTSSDTIPRIVIGDLS